MCTAMSIVSKQQDVFFGRTMDFYYDLDLDIYIVPQNYTFKSNISNYKKKNKYAYIGIGQYIGEISLADGMNEAGLGVAALYFPEYAEYTKKIDPKKIAIANTEVVTYLLSHCKNIEEVAVILSYTQIVGVKDDITKNISPLHWIVSDKTGKTITIEQTKNGLNILNNPIGVLTNSPDFAWHYTNLRNYMNLSPTSSKYENWENIKLSPFGEGAGSIGLPGDFTPPSRFVRLAFAKSFAKKPNTEKETLLLCFHLMNLVSIPKGLVIAKEKIKMCDYTQYIAFMNLNTGDYFFNTYDNCNIRRANIKDNKTEKVICIGKLKSKMIINHV